MIFLGAHFNHNSSGAKRNKEKIDIYEFIVVKKFISRLPEIK